MGYIWFSRVYIGLASYARYPRCVPWLVPVLDKPRSTKVIP